MKNIVRILVVILCLTFCLPVAACNKSEKNEKDTFVFDFSRGTDDFQLVRIFNSFGKAELNDDAQYVKEGGYSLKLRPLGNKYSSGLPIVSLPLSSERFKFDYTDARSIDKFTADIYNAEDGEIMMYYGLVGRYASVNDMTRMETRSIKLKPGWNGVEFSYSDINFIYYSSAVGVYFMFENAKSNDLSDAPTLYLDNIKVYPSPTTLEINPAEIIKQDAGEICGFEKTYQNFVFVNSNDTKEECKAELKTVYAVGEGISASEGEKVLKFVTKPGENVSGETWFRVHMLKDLLKPITEINEEELDSTYICFDVYAATEGTQFYIEFDDTSRRNWQAFRLDAVVGKWNTLKVKLSDLKENNRLYPYDLRIAWREYEGGERTYYFDNFRLERA